MSDLFNEYGHFLGEIPAEAVDDCTVGGQDASPYVKEWIAELGFAVPRDLAVKYLAEYGAWDDLDTVSLDTIAERVFWIACGDIQESGEWYGICH